MERGGVECKTAQGEGCEERQWKRADDNRREKVTLWRWLRAGRAMGKTGGEKAEHV